MRSGATQLLIAVTTLAALAASVANTANDVAASAVQTDHLVEIRGFVFNPTTITVKAGDRITWINKDLVPHTATAKNGSWATGLLNQGDSFTLTVTETMTLAYYCEYHPMMKAEVRLN